MKQLLDFRLYNETYPLVINAKLALTNYYHALKGLANLHANLLNGSSTNLNNLTYVRTDMKLADRYLGFELTISCSLKEMVIIHYCQQANSSYLVNLGKQIYWRNLSANLLTICQHIQELLNDEVHS